MEHHTSLKVFRIMLVGLLLIALFGTTYASLNILGMPMAVQPVGDVMDFSMGNGKLNCDDKSNNGGDDDDEDDGGSNNGGDDSSGSCLEVKASAWTLSNMYRDQPLFMNFRPRTEEAMLIDNICFTFFPLPDDQFTYVMYSSTVYRDGSNLIESDIVTDVQLGIFRAASPYCTYKDHVLGYAGCDTFVMYRCYMSNDCRNKNALFTFGLSQSCKQISISCLQKIEDIIQGNDIPEQDYVALPMKLPTKCVFDPVCTFKGEVEFFNTVGITQSEILQPVREVVVSPPPPIIVDENPVDVYEEYIPEPPVIPIVEEISVPIFNELPGPVSRYFGYENFYSRPRFGGRSYLRPRFFR